MTSENDATPPDLEELRRTLSQHPAAVDLGDKHERRRLLYDLLAGHDDPMFKEMGQQLRDNQMTLLDIANTSVYREHVFDAARERVEEFEESMCTFQEANRPESE